MMKMYRISGFLKVLTIWVFVIAVQFSVFVTKGTIAEITPIIIMIITTILFGLIAYFQDKGFKRIDKDANEKINKIYSKLDD